MDSANVPPPNEQSANERIEDTGNARASPGRFKRWAAAGFTGEIIPILPPGAKMAPESRINETQLGKIPGRWDVKRGLWWGLVGWTELTFTATEVSKWDRWPSPNVGLRTRLFHAVDIDVSNPEFVAAIRAAVEHRLGYGPVRGRGNSPRKLIIYRLAPGELPSRKARIAFRIPGDTAEHAVEFLGAGQQCVVAGTHPSGAQYRWETGDDPISVTAQRMTTVTAAKWRAAIAAVKEELERSGCTIVEATDAGDDGGERKQIPCTALEARDKDELVRALNCIPNERLSYELWITISHWFKMAVGGDEAHYPAYRDWCLRYKKNTPEDAEAKWASISSSAHGAEAIFDKAREFGYDGTTEDFEPITDDPSPQETLEERRRKIPPVPLSARYDEVIDRTIGGLALSQQNVYSFGVFMVEPGLAERKIWDGSTLKFMRVAHMNESKLLYLLARGVPFVKLKGKAGRPKKEGEAAEGKKVIWVEAQGPDDRLCKHILKQGQWPPLPRLTGIVTHPVVRSDGTIPDAAGYDEKTGLLTISDGGPTDE